MDPMESYDIFLIHDDFDNDEAMALKNLIENHVYLKKRHPTVCMSNDKSFIHIQSKFGHCEACIKHSKYVFLYVTPAFLKNQQWTKMRTDAALAHKCNIVPIFLVSPETVDKVIPFRGLNLLDLLQGKKLQDIIHDKSKMEKVKKSKFVANITKLLELTDIDIDARR